MRVIPLTKCVAALALVAVALAAGIAVAASTTSVPPTSTGFDISFPQCGKSFPSSPGFGIVGVNNGSPLTINNCLAAELTWAEGATNTVPGFYANTGNAGPSYAVGWPKSQSTPDACSGANSVACSYDYGWNAARSAFANAVNAEGADGSSSPTTAAAASPWWLDVETGNAWETIEYGRTSATLTYDRAMLDGMVASFTNMGVTHLGIYSTSAMWSEIAGGTDATLAPIPVWIPGFGSLAAAEVACAGASFTSGRVAMIQYPSQGLRRRLSLRAVEPEYPHRGLGGGVGHLYRPDHDDQ